MGLIHQQTNRPNITPPGTVSIKRRLQICEPTRYIQLSTSNLLFRWNVMSLLIPISPKILISTTHRRGKFQSALTNLLLWLLLIPIIIIITLIRRLLKVLRRLIRRIIHPRPILLLLHNIRRTLTQALFPITIRPLRSPSSSTSSHCHGRIRCGSVIIRIR